MFLHCQAFETDYLKDREAGFAGTRVTVSADPRSFTEKTASTCCQIQSTILASGIEMVTVKYYDSPLGLIFLAADDRGSLDSGLKARNISPRPSHGIGPAARHSGIRGPLAQGYFSGENPLFTPPLHLIGTDCQIAV